MISVLSFIPANLHPAIRNLTSTADVSGYVQQALDQLGTDDATLQFPPGVYRLNTPIRITRPGTTIEAEGALIVGMHRTSAGAVQIPAATGAGTTIRNGDWRIGSGLDSPWVFEVQAERVSLTDLAAGKLPSAGGYIAYVRFGADNFQMVNCRTYESNGIFAGASNALYMANRFVGRAVGGDDAVAIHAPSGAISNIRVVGNYVENLVGAASIGSAIGTSGANDPNRRMSVRDVEIIGNTCKNCANIARLKPNSVSTVDYRDGTVDGVTIRDNRLEDPNGTKCEGAIFITAGRGGIVRNVRGDNNVATARWNGRSGRSCAAIDIYLPDLSAENPGIHPPKIEDIDLGITFVDPHGGVPNSRSAPGHPFDTFIKIEKENVRHGSMRNIRLRVSGDGSLHGGGYVGPSLDDAVTFQRLRLNNVNRDGSLAATGLATASRIAVEDAVINMIAGNPFAVIGPRGEIVRPG